jgi:hypothetical protein
VPEPAGDWLILAHAFNMDGRAASQTITDKIPHLVAAGVRPIVVSAVTGTRDAHVEHHQVLPWSAVGLRFDLRHVLRRKIRNRLLYNVVLGAISLLLLPFYLLEKVFVRLETQWSWAPAAYRRAARIVRERRPVLVYSSGGANSAHLAAYKLARRFDLPWIAEIHDPMVVEGAGQSSMRAAFARELEGMICGRADVAIWFTDEALARARARNPALGDRGHSLVPGADAPKFVRTPHVRGDHLVIGHFGSLAPTRNLAVFLQALGNVLAGDADLARRIKVEIYGSGLDAISREALARFPAAGVVEVVGRLEADPDTGESGRDRVVKRMHAVDCLLLLHGTEDFCAEYIPSKLYEYLWAGRPILGLVWRNPQMAKILRDEGHWAVEADDAAGIEAALAELAMRWRDGGIADSGRASPYDVGSAVRRLLGWAGDAVALRK